MTRRDLQENFSERLDDWLRLNCGKLTVAEVVGVLTFTATKMSVMVLDGDGEDDFDEGESWKRP